MEDWTFWQKLQALPWIILIVTIAQLLSNVFSAWAIEKLEKRRKQKEKEKDE
ncbi:hypothetical protein HN803_06025 [candidate division WWE3 bacterium]|jgi:hypothetical protein|nr:hypothetical protein [candidate division WWE3 bacterium]MBT7350313.1 hypothetical protein [candidate division WWE3 bacterium]